MEQKAGISVSFLSRARFFVTIFLLLALLVVWAALDVSYVHGDSPEQTSTPTPESDCLQCHPRTLRFHDKLGSAGDACVICHDSSKMGTLRLLGGGQLPLSSPSPLCGQCHQERYDAWKEGTHGPVGSDSAECTDCHNPHQCEVTFKDVTEPHPEDISVPPRPPAMPITPVVLSLSVVTAVGIVVAWKRR